MYKKGHSNRDFIYLFLKLLIIALGFITLLTLCMTSLLKREYIIPYFEGLVIRSNGVKFILASITGVTILVIGHSLLRKINSRQLFLFFTVVFFISGLYLVINASTELNKADPLFVYKIANQMNHGDFKALLPSYSKIPGEGYKGYLAVYPFQLGFVTYLRLLEVFSTNVRFLYFVNVLLVIIINFILYKIVGLVTKNNITAQNWTVLLTYSFLPMLFFTLFIYGNIPGLCACLAAVYFGIRVLNSSSKRKFDWILCVLCFCIAYQLKSNYQISAIALGIIFIMHAIKERSWKPFLVTLAIFTTMYGSNTLIKTFYRLESGYQIQKGVPMNAYLTMGLQPDSSGDRGPGWYNSYTVILYGKENSNSEKTAQVAKRNLKEEINFYQKHPKKAYEFFLSKFISTWSDPTFQSVWIAPWKQSPRTKILKNIYYSNYNYQACESSRRGCWYQKSMKYISIWCNFTVVAILALSLGMLIRKKLCQNFYTLFAVLNLMGGMIFHLFWETKSQYVIQYIFCLIPVAAMFLGETKNLGTKKK